MRKVVTTCTYSLLLEITVNSQEWDLQILPVYPDFLDSGIMTVTYELKLSFQVTTFLDGVGNKCRMPTIVTPVTCRQITEDMWKYTVLQAKEEEKNSRRLFQLIELLLLF